MQKNQYPGIKISAIFVASVIGISALSLLYRSLRNVNEVIPASPNNKLVKIVSEGPTENKKKAGHISLEERFANVLSEGYISPKEGSDPNIGNYVYFNEEEARNVEGIGYFCFNGIYARPFEVTAEKRYTNPLNLVSLYLKNSVDEVNLEKALRLINTIYPGNKCRGLTEVESPDIKNLRCGVLEKVISQKYYSNALMNLKR